MSTLNSLSANLQHSLQGAVLQKHISVPQQGLAYALQSSNPETKAILLTEISDYLPQNLKEEALQEALAALRAIQFDPDRVDALRTLAPKLPPELLPEALAAARAFRWAWNRVYSLSALADKLPELLPEALAAARGIYYEPVRADELSVLAPKLPPELLLEALAVARDIRSESARTKALIGLASQLSKMQMGELFPLWQNILHSLSCQTRRDFLHDILALASVICALGDRAAVAEVVSAIQDVGRWWP